MRPHWPRTLLGQTTLLLITTVTVSQVVAVLVFMVFVQGPRVKDAAGLLAAQIMTVERLLGAVPEHERARYAAVLGGRSVLPPETVPIDDAMPMAPLARYEAQLFLAELGTRLPDGVELRMRATPAPRLWVQVHVAGQPYWISLPVERSARYRGALIAMGMSTALSALAALLAYLIHRRINRPLRRLAEAAARIGNLEPTEPLSLAGPAEIAGVSAAFNNMAQALADSEATRALMLAGISHDIRTPLTKLRLAMAMPEWLTAPQASAERFVDDIDAIVQQFIDYARGGEGEAFCATDLNGLIEQLAADFIGLGQPFALMLAPVRPVLIRPVSILRLLVNLMQNAAVYGRVGLEVRSWEQEDRLHIVVADRGPGVDADVVALLAQPFRRGDQPEVYAGGSGLGLAIADRIARQHGGSLVLRLRTGGGFEAELTLPHDATDALTSSAWP